ncbi:unnamed protein product, partial [marine sediment metagenome]
YIKKLRKKDDLKNKFTLKNIIEIIEKEEESSI